MRASEVPATARHVSFADLLRRYDRALERLEDLGVRLAPGNRLLAYRDGLSTHLEREPPVARVDTLRDFTYTLREIDEIVDVMDAVGPDVDQRERYRLEHLPKGSLHPDDDTDSQPRDLQFELWLRAFIRSKGLDCDLGDPDLQLKFEDRNYPLEAKRPKSRSSLDDRLRKALSQLDDFSAGGIVGLSVDYLLRPTEHHLVTLSGWDAQEKMDRIFHSLIGWLRGREAPVFAAAPGAMPSASCSWAGSRRSSRVPGGSGWRRGSSSSTGATIPGRSLWPGSASA